MTPEELAQMQAEKLGGGWFMAHGVVPFIILNTEEAAKLIGQINREPYAIEVKHEGKTLRFLWDDVTRIYASS